MRLPENKNKIFLTSIKHITVFILSILVFTFLYFFKLSSVNAEEDFIEIYTIEDLDNVRYDLDANYILMNDLDFEDCNSYDDCNNKDTYTTEDGWTPLGSMGLGMQGGYPFYGIFDGNGFEIKNLYAYRMEVIYEGAVGLFGVNSGTIIDLGVICRTDPTDNPSIEGEGTVGALVGLNDYDGKVINSYSRDGIISGNSGTGGLIGTNYGEVYYSFSSYGSVISTYEGGGLVGINSGDIYDSYAITSVNGYTNIAGFVGLNEGSIYNSYSVGSVEGYSMTGGLIANDYYAGDVYNSFWDIDTSGIEYSERGEGLTTEEMQDYTTYSYAEWDIEKINDFNPSNPSVWYIDDGNDYPRLFFEYQSDNNPPLIPSNLLCQGLTNPVKISTSTPYFSAIFEDPDISDTGDYYQIQVNTSSTFDGVSMWDSGLIEIQSINNGSRSSNITYAGSPLSSDGTTYFWRIRFADNQGAVSSWSNTTAFFIMTGPPIASVLYTSGATNPNFVSVPPRFSAIYTDPNNDNAAYYQIQVNTSANFNGSTMWDSGKTAITINSGNRSPNITYNGTALSYNGTTYYIRMKFWDTDNNGSNWISGLFKDNTNWFELEKLDLEGLDID